MQANSKLLKEMHSGLCFRERNSPNFQNSLEEIHLLQPTIYSYLKNFNQKWKKKKMK